jgi:hypothetical protein
MSGINLAVARTDIMANEFLIACRGWTSRHQSRTARSGESTGGNGALTG